jgi:hypothetical protein
MYLSMHLLGDEVVFVGRYDVEQALQCIVLLLNLLRPQPCVPGSTAAPPHQGQGQGQAAALER